jgi:hypothetical protein
VAFPYQKVPPMKRPASLLASLIVVGIAIPFTPAIGRWLHSLFWFTRFRETISLLPFWISVVLLTFLLYRLVLTALTSRGAGGPWIRELYERCIGGTVWEIYRRRLFPEKRLGMLLGTWTVLILAIVFILYTSGVMDNSELLLPRVGMARLNQDSVPIVRSFTYYSADKDPITYLRDLTTITRHLKAAGARMVVAEDPQFYATRDSTLLRTVLVLKDSLRKSGVLLHEQRSPSWFWRFTDREPASDTCLFRPSEASLSVLLRPSEDFSQLPPRWYPALYRSASPRVDLGLFVAARILGIPDTVSVQIRPDRIIYGDIQISTDSKGMALPLAGVELHRVGLDVMASRDLRSDTLWYTYFRYREFKMERLLEFPAKGVEDARGTIVFVSWMFWPDDAIPTYEYAEVISSLLHGTVARRYGNASLWISALVVGLSLWLALKVRLLYAVPLILLLAAGLFFGGAWLLFQHSIMLDAAYPAVAALLSGIIFPVVRWSHEHP